ncbi:MAG: hypothetical protein ABSE16_16845 [Verrucomicrobiota bacterium]|jgi:hypothetical protein
MRIQGNRKSFNQNRFTVAKRMPIQAVSGPVSTSSSARKPPSQPPKEVYQLPSFEHWLTQWVLTNFAHLQSFLAAANSVIYRSFYIE